MVLILTVSLYIIYTKDLLILYNTFKTPICIAAEKGFYEIAKLLINRKCDLNIRTNEKKTLIHLAIFSKSLEILELLIHNGVKLNKICIILYIFMMIYYYYKKRYILLL